MPHSSMNNMLEHGEHTAYGKATRREINGPNGHLANRQDFAGHSMRGQWEPWGVSRTGETSHRVYRVYSYETCIAEWDPATRYVTLDRSHYSAKTTEHQNAVAAWLAYQHRFDLIEEGN